MVGYASIPSAEAANGSTSSTLSYHAEGVKPTSGCNKNGYVAIICGVLGLMGLISFSRYLSTANKAASGGMSVLSTAIPMPEGVNLGSWLSLEDYFYVGPSGAVEVATPNDKTVGSCLPPLHVGPDTGPKWNSETDLYANLKSMKGGSVKRTIQIFHSFRTSYLDWEEELSQIYKLGITRVRVPISWCITDYDASTDPLLLAKDDDIPLSEEDEAELEQRYTCLDPFFAKKGEMVRWPAVPRPFLASFLRACSRHKLKATLDIHTYPGGTSIGTFSGVWPRRSLFWEYDDPENVEKDVGRGLLRDFFAWVASLRDSDPLAFEGIGGITPMNEPGHLAGLFGPGSANPSTKSFLPSLPDNVAQDFLSELGVGNGGISVPDGPHLRVLKWQSDAIDAFRKTTLTDDIDLYVNVHESIFTPSLAPKGLDDDKKLEFATAVFGAWWAKATTPEERTSSIVLDMHRYHAWGPSCQGTVDGPPNGNYTCGDKITTSETLARCASWAAMYRQVMDEQLGEGARLMSAEFSASTHHSVLLSCTDTTTLRQTYLAQVEAATDHEVELFWWSFKMPHGGMFRPAWSFKHFLHRLGVEGFGPDESEIVCGSRPL